MRDLICKKLILKWSNFLNGYNNFTTFGMNVCILNKRIYFHWNTIYHCVELNLKHFIFDSKFNRKFNREHTGKPNLTYEANLWTGVQGWVNKAKPLSPVKVLDAYLRVLSVFRLFYSLSQ